MYGARHETAISDPPHTRVVIGQEIGAGKKKEDKPPKSACESSVLFICTSVILLPPSDPYLPTTASKQANTLISTIAQGEKKKAEQNQDERMEIE